MLTQQKCQDMFDQFKKMSEASSNPMPFGKPWFILTDYSSTAGFYEATYTPQDIWGARLVHQHKPGMHFDIGSRFDGFITHCLVFTKVTYLDIRPLPISLENLTFLKTDATTLAEIPDRSIRSLSALHSIEHFGLGRYGDEIDPDAHIKAMKSIQRVLAVGGNLYFSVPIGIERIVFNAHRIYAPKTITHLFEELELVEFRTVPNITVQDINTFIPTYDQTGLFHFTRRF